MSDLDLAAFKAKLSGIASEHSSRMADVRQKFDESAKATQESHDKFADRKQRLTARLREMARNQRGENQHAHRAKELSFGLEDESAAPHDDLAEELAQIEKERQARELRAQSEAFMSGRHTVAEAPVRQPPAVAQPVAPPPQLPPPPVRQPPPSRRPRPPVDDDDDLSNQSWLS
ncbi:hypothetical protein SAMN05216553_102589 [Lentzea fradiae]|uniref:Uncharacterized protein n=1 Tax=Lentzea fradiae TaxID=200378 RepID=A0A1G7MZ98_9PSEU|nr:hypothetical protein [Lentzea fradiae]SDF67042.1 hypothetical protein SAMN05216553_102589 [Lentzea fradiae]